MAARFPQSATSVAYRIKAEYAGAIKAIYWAASADSVHRLYPDDTATTIITRAASGATFNADGRIVGNVNGTGGVYFADSSAAGLGVAENSAFGYGIAYYGDLFAGVTALWAIGAGTPLDTFNDVAKIKLGNYQGAFGISGMATKSGGNGISNNVKAYADHAMRYDPADAVNHVRVWSNGTEDTGLASNATATATATIGTTAKPLKFGGTSVGTGNTTAEFEACYVFSSLTDAQMAAITTNPSIIIEEVTGGAVTHVTTGSLTAGAATMAGTSAHIATHVTSGTLVAGAATLDGTSAREGAATTHVTTGALVAGAATVAGTSSHAASGSFVSDVLGNNTSSIWASTAVVWEWREGTGIGVAPTSVTYGTGTTSSLGVLTCMGLPTGAGELLIATTDYTGVAYQRGTVA